MTRGIRGVKIVDKRLDTLGDEITGTSDTHTQLRWRQGMDSLGDRRDSEDELGGQAPKVIASSNRACFDRFGRQRVPKYVHRSTITVFREGSEARGREVRASRDGDAPESTPANKGLQLG